MKRTGYENEIGFAPDFPATNYRSVLVLHCSVSFSFDTGTEFHALNRSRIEIDWSNFGSHL